MSPAPVPSFVSVGPHVLQEDRGSRARRRSPQQASPPRNHSYPGESVGKGSATDEEFQDDGLSSTLEQCTVSGDFDDDVDDGGGEPILTGFDLRAALGLEDPIELKRQLRWLHNLVSRDGRRRAGCGCLVARGRDEWASFGSLAAF